MSKRKWQLLSVVLVLVAFFALSGVIQAQIQSHFQARDPASAVGRREQGARLPA